MSFPILLDEYIPALNEIPEEKFQEVYTRIRSVLAEEFPELKTSPNSTWGNLFLRPLAMTIAAYEIAASRVAGDVLLENVASGNVYNCDFVREFLKNYGITDNFQVPVIGTVRMVFNVNKSYSIDRGSGILFGTDQLFNLFAPYPGRITIDPVGAPTGFGNWHRLSQTGPSEYSVDLVVIGVPASDVEGGSLASTDIPDPEIVSITAVSDFKPGIYPDDLKSMAGLAQKIFSSATLTTRSGAVNFVTRAFPHISSVSPVLSGDDEMQRDKSNILGISEGKVDIHVKSADSVISVSQSVTLAKYEEVTSDYHGLLDLPNIPLMIDSISLNDEKINTYDIVSFSENNSAPKLSAAYGKFERLGLKIKEADIPAHTHTPGYTNIVEGSSEGYDLILDPLNETYRGWLWDSAIERFITLEFLSVVTIGGNDFARARATDSLSGRKSENVLFDNTGVLDLSKSDLDAVILLNGLSLSITNWDSAANVAAAKPVFKLNYKAPSVNVTVNYRYDKTVGEVDTTVNNPDEQSVIDTYVRGFLTCKVTKLKVNYRRKQGTYVNRSKIRDEILEYVNGLGYPNLYEQSEIADIALYNGASGVQSVEQEGIFMPSLANLVATDPLDIFTPVNFEQVIYFNSNTLLPEGPTIDSINTGSLKPLNTAIGPRNVSYILDVDDIELNEVRN